MRPDGRLFFWCEAHEWPDQWFMAESWSLPTEWVNTHLDAPYSWTTDMQTRLEFTAGALTVFLRSGEEDDALILQGTMPDNYVRFHHLADGDGRVLTEVNTRVSSLCTVCPKRPLPRHSLEILDELGFAPPGDWREYSSEAMPVDPEQFTAVTDDVFRRVFELPEDYGILARFKRPAMAEAFYLWWMYGARGD